MYKLAIGKFCIFDHLKMIDPIKELEAVLVNLRLHKVDAKIEKEINALALKLLHYAQKVQKEIVALEATLEEIDNGQVSACQFFEERVERTGKIPSPLLYNAYSNWCAERAKQCLSAHKFRNFVASLHIVGETTSHYIVYHGIQLKQ
jgi:thymidine phosphorylase